MLNTIQIEVRRTLRPHGIEKPHMLHHQDQTANYYSWAVNG